MSVCRTVVRLACRSVDPVGYSVWLSVGVVGQSVGLSVNRNWSARQLVSLSLEALGLHCIALGVPLASFVRSWARLWDVLGSFLGALGLHFGALEVLLASFLGSWARLWGDLGLMFGGLGVSLVPWGVFLALEKVRLAANGSRSYHFGSILDGFGMDFRDPNHSGSHVFF